MAETLAVSMTLRAEHKSCPACRRSRCGMWDYAAGEPAPEVNMLRMHQVVFEKMGFEFNAQRQYMPSQPNY